MSMIPEEEREIVVDFINESNEAIENTELTLLKLEDSVSKGTPVDLNLVNTVFRTFHSIKGSAGFIGFEQTNKLTHDAENLLDMIRKDKLDLQKAHIDIFLEVCDFLTKLLDHIGENFTESGFEEDVLDLQGRLRQLTDLSVEEKSSTQPTNKQNPTPKKQDSRKKEEVSSSKVISADALISPEMVDQFISESTELLDSLEQDLLALEENPQEKELVQNAFRSLHSLKGNAGFMNYGDINSLAHKAETFLDKVRNDQVRADSKQISMILQVLDFIRAGVDSIKQGHEPTIPGKVGLLDLMEEIFGAAREAEPKEKVEVVEEKEPIQEEPDPQVDLTPEQVELEMPEEEVVIPEKDIQKAVEELQQKEPTESIPPRESNVSTTNTNLPSRSSEVIRVDVGKLNKLMDLVGEIVIAELMVSQHPELAGMHLEGFEKATNYLQKNIRELQDLATSMRMIPLSGVFGKMKRLVRDISAKKQNMVDLIILGGETEVDRSVIEHISDPLVHMLRNSIDHGIEMPDERSKAGKKKNGTIQLEAKRVGGEIWIVVQDDGKGLDKDRIVIKAREKGLISEDEELTDAQIYSLIFKPGLSTVKKVSDLSGRGVGMDVVLKNIEKIRGRIDVQSVPGQSTTMIMKIPLTTAIVDGMLMRLGDSIYAIPTLDIKESLQVKTEDVVSLVDGQEVINVRDSLIPVLRLQEIHEIKGQRRLLEEGIVVVAENNRSAVGFLVDEVIGQQQLVIKPVPAYLGNIQGVSGCAVLGNGEICLILDLNDLIKLAETVVNSSQIGDKK